MFLKGAEQLCFCCVLHPFSKVGNSRLHSTPTDYLSFYGRDRGPHRDTQEERLTHDPYCYYIPPKSLGSWPIFRPYATVTHFKYPSRLGVQGSEGEPNFRAQRVGDRRRERSGGEGLVHSEGMWGVVNFVFESFES